MSPSTHIRNRKRTEERIEQVGQVSAFRESEVDEDDFRPCLLNRWFDRKCFDYSGNFNRGQIKLSGIHFPPYLCGRAGKVVQTIQKLPVHEYGVRTARRREKPGNVHSTALPIFYNLMPIAFLYQRTKRGDNLWIALPHSCTLNQLYAGGSISYKNNQSSDYSLVLTLTPLLFDAKQPVFRQVTTEWLSAGLATCHQMNKNWRFSRYINK